AQELQQFFRRCVELLDAISALYAHRDAEEHGSELYEVRRKLSIAVCELHHGGPDVTAAFSNHIAKPACQFRCHPGRHAQRHLSGLILSGLILSGLIWSPGSVACQHGIATEAARVTPQCDIVTDLQRFCCSPYQPRRSRIVAEDGMVVRHAQAETLRGLDVA